MTSRESVPSLSGTKNSVVTCEVRDTADLSRDKHQCAIGSVALRKVIVEFPKQEVITVAAVEGVVPFSTKKLNVDMKPAQNIFTVINVNCVVIIDGRHCFIPRVFSTGYVCKM